MRLLAGYLKMLLDLFQVQYETFEAILPAWKAKRLLKTVVCGDLAPHQMFYFNNEFEITDTIT